MTETTTYCLDSQGYPTEGCLEYFKKEHDIKKILEILKKIWYFGSWGLIKHRQYKGYFTVELHTDGWSGNEDLINSLSENFYFWTYWRRHDIGGHYYFKFPIKYL